MVNRRLFLAASIVLLAFGRPAPAATIAGYASLGASESAGTTYTGSWVPYLANQRGLNFGGTNQPYNVAVGGARTDTLLTQGQHTEVRDLVQAGLVEAAYLFIGGNDAFAAGLSIASGALSGAALEEWAQGLVDNIMVAVDTVLGANPAGMIVAGLPDITLTPAGRPVFSTAQTRARGVAAVDLVNSLLLPQVLDRGQAFIDTAAALRDLNAAPLTVGGVLIDTVVGDPDPTHFFQDGRHPAAVGNGIFANLMLTASNIALGTEYALLSDQEVLNTAGLLNQYTGETTTLDYARYVIVPEPPALIGDANGDCSVGAADYALWAAQLGQSGQGLSADFDGSGEVGAADYALWAANFGKTCSPAPAPVPEPGSWLLALVGGLLAVTMRKGTAGKAAGAWRAQPPMRRRFALGVPAIGLVLGLLPATSTRADILHGLATMGDSSSIKSQPYKFPVMMQTYRGLNFGGANLPYVRAVGGATSTTMLTQMQPQKVATDVAAGKVTVTTVLVGNNDYGQNILELLLTGLTEQAMAGFENTVVSNIETAVNTVLDAGIEGVLLGGVPRLLTEPIAAPYIPQVPQELLDLLDASQMRVNARLLEFANQKHVPFVDFFGMGLAFGDSDHITVGGVPINLGQGPTANYFFVDGLHPGWIGNAVISNLWMEALNIAYGTNLALFSDQEALSMANLSGYTGETFSNVFNYADYIHYNPPVQPQVVAASLGSGSLVRIDSAGQGSTYADSSDGLLTPLDAAYDSQGNLFVSDVLRSRITRFDSAGVATTFAEAADGATLPTSLAFSADGTLFVTSYLANTVVQFDAQGAATPFGDAADGLDSPFGVTVDPSGHVFVANLSTAQILEFDTAGNVSVFADAADGLFTPIDVLADPLGNIYVADALKSRVYRFTPDGVGSVYADLADGLSTPSGLALDAAGNLYVADYLSNKIIRIDPAGVGTLYADASDGLDSPFGLAFLGETPAFGAALLARSGAAASQAVVPEPASWLLGLLGGLLSAAGLRARRRSSPSAVWSAMSRA